MSAFSSAAVVPAAGASTRFGSVKLLASVAGEPLLQHTLRSLLDAHIQDVVLVVPPRHGLDSIPLMRDPRVRLIENPDPARGMFSSIQTGIATADADIVLVLPADMPFVPTEIVAALATRCAQANRVVVPEYDGRRGHPVAIPRRYLAALRAAAPTTSLKEAVSAIAGWPPETMAVEAAGVVRDIDVPADLERGA